MKIADFYPQTFDVEKLEKKGWLKDENFTSEFTSLYQTYTKLLEQYIEKKVGLNEMDEVLENSKFNLKTVSLSDQDIYQSLSSFKYLYIRNTLHLETLDTLELQQLQKHIKENKIILDEELYKMLEHSYKKVISVNNVEDGTYINYGPYTSGQYYAPNNVLVIGVRFDPEYDKETTDINYNEDEWDENNDKQEQLVRAVIDTLNKENNLHPELPIKAIEYNEFSVNKKSNIKNKTIKNKTN